MDWVVLLPVKASPAAKSRLAAAWPDPHELAALVHAMRLDTVAAIRATPGVVGVVAAVDEAHAAHGLDAGIDVVVQRSAGLDAALTEADVYAAARWPTSGRIAIVGDLPALTPGALAGVLAQAAEHPRSFVPDLAGSGTAMLAVTVGGLDPRFGAGSAARHGEQAVALAAAPGARHDVDVPADLVVPPGGGFGSATSAVLARHRDRVGCPST